MFDMLTGEPPFSAPTKRETQDLILRGRISQPTGVSAQAKDLLKNLLKRNHLTRLGSGERDALDIQVILDSCFVKRLLTPFISAPLLVQRNRLVQIRAKRAASFIQASSYWAT